VEVELGLTDAGITEQQDWGTATDLPPTITSTPQPLFQLQNAATYDMTQHVSDDGLSAVSYSLSNVLPNGLQFNASTGILDYDGIGESSVSAHQLTATDAVGSDTSASFNITISAVEQFTFVDQSSVALSTLITSAPIIVAGLVPPQTAIISIDSGEYQINGGAWTSLTGFVENGDSVAVRHTSSVLNSTATNQTLTIGGVQDTFTSTTEAAVGGYVFTHYVAPYNGGAGPGANDWDPRSV
jgi:hypothetical protein